MQGQQIRAQFTPRNYTTLSAELGAKIKRIGIREGQRFTAGQTLVEFDCSLQVAQLGKSKAHLNAVQNTLSANQRLADFNAVGKVELKNSEVEVVKAKADIDYLQAMLEKCRIQAPFDGIAGEQVAREQQYVQPGQSLLEILDDGELELEFIVPTRWLLWLKPGHDFSVRIDDTKKTYPVKLQRIAPRADPVSQSVRAVAVLDGQYPELIAGMSGEILLEPLAQP